LAAFYHIPLFFATQFSPLLTSLSLCISLKPSFQEVFSGKTIFLCYTTRKNFTALFV
jgi:hypothetical protein